MAIAKILNDVLPASNFRRFGKKWARERKEFFDLFHVQHSAYGSTSYVNIGVCLKNKPIGKVTYDDLILVQRLGRLLVTDSTFANRYANGFNNDLGGPQEEVDFRHAIDEALTKFFPLCDSVSSIRQAIGDGKIPKGAIGKELSILLRK